MSNTFIWSIDRTLSGATTPGQSGPGSDVNEGVLRIHHSSSIMGALPSDCLLTYPGHSLGETYFSAEMQSVYSAGPVDLASVCQCVCMCVRCVCIGEWVCVCVRVFSRPLHHRQNTGQNQFLSGVQLVWIKNFFLFESSLPYYLPIVIRKTNRFMHFPRALVPSKTQTFSPSIWNGIADSISYDNNCYTKCASRACASVCDRVCFGMCGCKCGYVCVCLSMYGCVCVSAWMFVNARTCVCALINECVYILVNVCVSLCGCLYVCVHACRRERERERERERTCSYVSASLCVYVCVCVQEMLYKYLPLSSLASILNEAL